MKNKQILILDLGSQYTLVIARQITKMGVQCRVVRPAQVNSLDDVRGIILSGSNYSVNEENAPSVPELIFTSGIPVLGICYGMQYMVFREDPSLVWASAGKKEYGPVGIELSGKDSVLFTELPNAFMAYASHGDTVHQCPPGYFKTAESPAVSIQAMQHESKPWYGVQFHPEVDDTQDEKQILKNFVFLISQCAKDWDPDDSIEEIVKSVTAKVKAEDKVLLGVSGGVDSTTLARILSSELGPKLYCLLIDHGGLRHNEVKEVQDTCTKYRINLHVEPASPLFFERMKVYGAEEKRKKFQEVYQEVFTLKITEWGITKIIQGTLATDLIESGAAGSSVKIKTHHNVGLKFGVEELTPFAHLFKHEVRDIARQLNLNFAERQPFPGPGLYLRMPGIIPTVELMQKLRAADHLVSEILKEEFLYDKISQLVVGLIGVDTVGVGGDGRTYTYPIVIRAVQTSDFMTASAFIFPENVRQRITFELTSHGLTNRVWWDETPKPPATTEFE